ncbi:hypothetical protein F5X98DRAFT_337245 [Xylaria grammica]|nr:hypothetical protein F5X98DRAFT_337245 [Xylaria grammica]
MRFQSSRAMGIRLDIKAIPPLNRRMGTRVTPCLRFLRTYVTTQPRTREVPRLSPFNAYKTTPERLVKTYTGNLARGDPMLIRNLPGFLNGQSWIDHTTDYVGSFKTTRRKEVEPDFDILKSLLSSAIAGFNPGPVNSTSEPADLKAVFDNLQAECVISRDLLEGDNPPLLKFRDWLQNSQFRDYSLEKILVELQTTYQSTQKLFLPFSAPLVFFRAVHQYNCDNYDHTGPAGNGFGPGRAAFRVEIQPGSINKVGGLVILKEDMTEEFPFPRIVRDIGQSTYTTKQCSIRVGVRPPRSAIRRYRGTTVVIGQLAGFSVVTMVPPRLQSLGGLPLEFHERIPKTWETSIKRFPLGPKGISLSKEVWTRDFEAELAAAGEILVATLVPGDGLLVPEGWWYGPRSVNNGLELQTTVTWFLDRGKMAAEDHKGRREFPPLVEI